MPAKTGSGVNVTSVAVKVTVPSVGGGWLTPTTVSGSPLGSTSFCNTSTVTGVFVGVLTMSSFATGGALPVVTVTVAVAEPPCGSSTR